MYTFPNLKLNSDKRKEWVRDLRRKERNREYTPGQRDMVCSEFFADRRPSLENPNPTLDLGYDRPAKKSRRELVKSISKVPVTSKTLSDAMTRTAANNEFITAASDEVRTHNMIAAVLLFQANIVINAWQWASFHKKLIQ